MLSGIFFRYCEGRWHPKTAKKKKKRIGKKAVVTSCSCSRPPNNSIHFNFWGGPFSPGEADYYAFFFFLVKCIFPEASGYLFPNMIRFDQNYMLWGLLGGKKVTLLDFTDDKI